jgi:Zn-finger nucleic acid-binding protein
MKCPHCQTDMAPKTISDTVQVDVCWRCSGVWLGPDEFEAARDRPNRRVADWPGEAFKAAADGTARNCPRCEKASLLPGHIGRTHLHLCFSCAGAYMKQDELQNMVKTQDPYVELLSDIFGADIFDDG